MNTQKKKQQRLSRRSHRTRSRLIGTAERPRMAVHRTLAHIRVQFIDDANGVTLASADDKDLKGTKTEIAVEVGKRAAEAAKAAKLTTVIFDRGPRVYHGRVKALAEGAREAGLQF